MFGNTTQQVYSSEKALLVRVNQLFEKNNVQSVRVLHKNTAEDIETKKQTLRSLVGNRYRDLIHSADSIIEMKTTSGNIQQHLHSIEDKSSRLQHIMRSPLKSDKQEASSSSHFFTIANEIKQLVDTPEKIWVALEQHNYLNASDMYLEAFARYEQLRSGDQDVQLLLKSIPLLSRQWATINQFPSKIESQSNSRLLECDVTAVDLSRALYALSQLQSLTIEDSFSLFINARKEAVKNLVSTLKENNENTDSHAIKRVLQLARMLQQTIIHTASIFVSTEYLSPGEREILLDTFQGIDYTRHQPLFVELLRTAPESGALVSLQVMRDTCTKWMAEVSQLLQSATGLLDQIESAEKLVFVELQVWQQLHSADDDKDIWSSVRKMLLPDEFQDLWSSVFHRLFFAQSKQIIVNQFHSLDLSPLVIVALDDIKSSNEANNTGYYVWNYVEEESLSLIKNKSTGISESMLGIVSKLDEQLSSFIQDLEFLTNNNISKQLKSSSFAITKQTSTSELREFIQSHCYETLSKEIHDLGEQINQLLKSKENKTSLEQILFLSQLCSAIAQSSVQIPKILPNSSSATMPDNSRFTSYSYFSLRAKTIVNPLKEKLSYSCQLQYIKGHLWWALQKSRMLSESLEEALQAENWTNTSLRKTTWATIEVPMKTNAKEQIKVPNFPSAFISRFLFASCKAFHEQAAHVTDSQIIRFFSHVLALRVLDTYTRFINEIISDSTKQLSREGLVQVLFDVRFLFDVLAGAYQSADEWTDIVKSAYEELPQGTEQLNFTGKLRQNISSFISLLKKQFEPIDLAFYEPRVQQYVQKSYLQSVVSLGYFINTKRLYLQASKTSFERPNIIPLVSPVARFPTLPIGSRKL